jgi:hypothetical protein
MDLVLARMLTTLHLGPLAGLVPAEAARAAYEIVTTHMHRHMTQRHLPLPTVPSTQHPSPVKRDLVWG